YNQNIDFTAWGYDFVTPEVLPTNTYRICTDRVNSSLSSVDVFDYSASGGTNFTQSMSGASTPSSGYYVGGTDPSYGWGGFTLDGDVAELALYKGYLTEADRLTVQNYLQQKYFQIGGSFLDTYQWQFDGTNIAGATNAVLTLTNVQGANGGQYTVIVTDDAGSITSSNAVLLVGSAPAISIEPQSQEVSAGTNVTFSVGATGTAPLNYQWTLDGTTLAQATNSTLTLTNLSQVNSGTYAVTITSPFGVAASSNAFLTVDVLPVFGTQPQGQSVVVGSNATFSVAVRPTSIPPVTSGELQLWLKADAGVITNASGQVSQWEDQSGNTNDAVQSTTNYQPSLVFPPALGGNAAVRFNGNANNINYLHGSGNVGVSSAMTSFTVIDAFSVTNYVPMAWLIGVPSIWGSDRSETAYGGSRDFTTWGYGYIAPFVVPTNTYRIWSDRVNTNLTTLELFDTTAAGSTNFAGAMPPTSPVGAGYYVGGLNPALSQVAGWKLNGDISEFIVYKGQLTDGDRLAVLNYLQEKYFEGGVTVGDTFQWQFDGTNIAGATNATLTITNVQGTDAGTYTVVVTDPAGSVTSSNAVLTALFPAAITTSPISQAVSAGTTVTFTGVASGTAPLSYQWQFGGTNITDATNTTLIVTNAVVANAGNYTLVASNPYGSSTSTPATLSVDESTIQVVSTSASAASTVVVSINFIALGTESGVGFTLNFDPAVMTYVDTAVGSGASGSAMQVNTNQIGSGHLGLGAAEFSGTFPAGTNDVFDITFHTSVVTNTTTTSLTFGNSAANEEISGPTANSLPGVYLPGVIVVSSTSLEGDVSPRPNGDEVMNISDWIQEGRFVAGLDTITNASEFQRADCAPRSTLGDGELTVADWVQVGRYAVGLDQLTALGGPIAPAPSTRQSGHPGKESDSPALTLVPLSQGAQMNSVSVQLASQGEVNSAGFSVTYNPALVQFINATLASGATGAAFIQNTNSARPGVLGFVVGSLAPATFPAGTAPLVTLNFAPVAFSNTTALAFANLPVACQLADANAQPLSANFVNASLAVGGGLWPTLAITPNGNDISLSWPSSGASFTLQAASSLSGAWSNVVVTPTTNGNTVTLTAPVTGDSVYYRLKY
ncbi:MAG TPA: immunoglobulin domain-containing protein, partial [Verrucomicrobiae bacterium]